MTLAEMSGKMSNAEFEIWLALAVKKQDECPNCGHEPNELMDVEMIKTHCPICANDYYKSAPVGMFKTMEHSSIDLESL